MADESRVPALPSLGEAERRRRRFLQAGLATAASTLVPTAARADPFVPNETQVSAAQDLVDLEYSPSLAMYCRVDHEGRLWVGDVDRATGNLVQADGRQILADADAQTIDDIKLTLSGPECNVQSMEAFAYGGRTYMFMSMKSTHDYPHEIWCSNIDTANPFFRCITKSTAFARDDPEFFITDHGPIIYFNMWDPSLPRQQGGSLGLWRSDPGVS